MRSAPRRIDAGLAWPLYDAQATRQIEHTALARELPNTLMPRAGLATARLAMALAPHARTIWVAAGPGNNGGDGLEAAAHLQRWGKAVTATWLGTEATASDDTRAAWRRASDAGVSFADAPPAEFDLVVDALLGIGASRPPQGRMADWVTLMNQSPPTPVLAVDLPTGLDADTGHAAGCFVRAHATLSLLTLKPGLFTALGRDAAGSVWFDDLGVSLPEGASDAYLPCAQLAARPARRSRPHASHKGSHGDVAVVGGAPGMAGAAILAASAALHGGAGRVYLASLDEVMPMVAVPGLPELMLRRPAELPMERLVVVCGCGGGDLVRSHLPAILARAPALVLDADALNAIAADPQLQAQLRARGARQRRTVLTPHPLEAARLLGCDSATVQRDRIKAVGQLVKAFGCTVVLKGSGSLVAAPGQVCRINPTGNARLATAGTGDVLAGAIGAALGAGLGAFEAALEAVYLHGQCADQWSGPPTLTAGELARRLAPA